MHDTNSLGKYAGLIFTKLDLPPVPDVDAKKILAWMSAVHRKLMVAQIQGFNAVYPDKVYPWRPVWAHDGTNWDGEFATQFPEIVAYVNLFPATEWRRVCLLAQLPDEEVFPHVDPDLGIGWRVYLTSGGPHLCFNKFKNWCPNQEDAQAAVHTSAIASRIEPERIRVPAPERPYPWALTSVCAGHSVEKNTGTAAARIVVLIMPKKESIDVAAHHALLRRSTEKFAAEAIWY
jgi:hypothetical protein